MNQHNPYMPPSLYLFLLFIVSRPVLSLVRELQCRRLERDNATSIELDCSHQGLTSYGVIEGDRVAMATDLLLSNNNLTDFPVARLSTLLPHLRRLRLDNNFIPAPTATDTSWPSLNHLDLSGNHLSEITARHFVFGRHLLSLNLSRNRIRSVTANAWLNVHRLEFLDLSSNGVAFISEDWFWGLWKLQELRLSGNAIFHLFQRTFTHLRSLRRLDLSANKIRIIDNAAFAEQLELDLLKMDGNHLNRFPQKALANFRRVKLADFSANRFYKFEEGAVETFNASEILMDRQQRLVSLSSSSFRHLPLTEHISISRCPKLQFVAPDSFQSCTNLSRLDVANNGLTAFPARDIFHHLITLQALDISGNPFLCQCDLLSDLRSIEPPHRLVSASEIRCSLTEGDHPVLTPNISCESSPLVIGTSRGRVPLPEGHSLVLQCRSYPSDNVSVKWYLPSVADDDQSVRRRLHVIPTGDLRIDDALPAHSGTYRCRASASDGLESNMLNVTVQVRPLHAHLILLDRRSTSLIVTWKREGGSRRSMSSLDRLLDSNLLVIYKSTTESHFQHILVRTYMKSVTLADLVPRTEYLVCLAIRSTMDVHRLHCLHTSTTEDTGNGIRQGSDWFQNGTFVVVIVATLGVSLGLLVACLIYCNLQKDSKAIGRQTHDSTVSLAALESGASTPLGFENRAIIEDVDGEAEAEFAGHLSLREMAAIQSRLPFMTAERRKGSDSRPEALDRCEGATSNIAGQEDDICNEGQKATTAEIHVAKQSQEERVCVT